MVSIVQYGKICYNQISFIFDEIDYLQESLKQEISKNKKDIIYQKTLKEAEIILIENALKENNYNKSKTADRLGIDRTTLNRKLSKSN
ncbi:MAG: helix-turn-helix domain-containing protein [Intestinibacter bartlettii]